MNKRIRKKIEKQQESQGQHNNAFTWSSQLTFIERVTRDHYLRLESLQPDHPLLQFGNITPHGRFKIIPGYQTPGQDVGQRIEPLDYDRILRDELYALGATHVLRPLSPEALEELTQKHWEKVSYQAGSVTR